MAGKSRFLNDARSARMASKKELMRRTPALAGWLPQQVTGHLAKVSDRAHQ
jgi:hypothetical protein